MNYRITLACHAPEWWRYNLLMTLVGYDAHGRQCDYGSLVEPARSDGKGLGAAPQREVALAGDAVRAAAWIYLIASVLSGERAVEACPDFEVTLTAWRDGRELLRKTCMVNPWGGLSVVGLEL